MCRDQVQILLLLDSKKNQGNIDSLALIIANLTANVMILIVVHVKYELLYLYCLFGEKFKMEKNHNDTMYTHGTNFITCLI